MSVKLWFAFFACLSPLIVTSGSLAGEKPQSFQERWKLEFFPEELPDQRSLLSATAWGKTGIRNILGAGTDLVIRFPTAPDPRTEFIPFPPAGPRGEAEIGIYSVRQPVEFSRISHLGFPGEPITETTEKYHQSLIVGPCLEYGGRVRTLHVVQDQQFLLNAVVPVNSLQWYTVRVDFTDADPIGRPKPDRPTRITEFLYEFGADPLQVDEGPLTIHYHSRDSREEKTTISHFHRTFRKEPPPKYIPGVRRISTGLTPLLFYPEFNVAVTDENHRDLFESEALQPLTHAATPYPSHTTFPDSSVFGARSQAPIGTASPRSSVSPRAERLGRASAGIAPLRGLRVATTKCRLNVSSSDFRHSVPCLRLSGPQSWATSGPGSVDSSL